MIREEECCDVFVCGIATDVCVGNVDQVSQSVLTTNIHSASTAHHANELGFRTILIDNCSRGINHQNIQDTFERLKAEWACVVQSSEVKAMVQGKDRRPQLGIKLALECRKNIIYPAKNKNSKFNNQKVNPDGTLVNKDG